MPTSSASVDSPTRTAHVSRRPPPIVVSGALVALLLAACTSAPDPATDSPPDPHAVVSAAWEVDADIVGGTATTEDGIVAYERREGDFVVSAWSLEGERLWSEPADPGWMTQNDELTATVDERDGVWTAIHLSAAEAGSRLRGVIVREVATGDLVASAPGVIAIEPPHRCDAASLALCVVGWDSERRYESAQLLRFDPGSRLWEVDQEGIHPAGTRRLSPSVFIRGDGSEESLGAFAEGEALWEQPLAGLLGAHRGHSSWGVSGEDADSILLWFAQPLDEDGSLELADQAVLAVDSATGERRWIERGAGLCGALRHAVQTDPVVVCRFEAGSEFIRSHGRRASGIVMSMAGRDLQTGEELRSAQIDGHSSHVMWAEERHSAPSGFATVHINGSLHRLDLRTGRTEAVDDDATFACGRESGAVTLAGSGEELDFDGGLSHFPCDASGERVSAWTAAESAGSRANDSLIVIRTPEGLAGFAIASEKEPEDEHSTRA
ncbi:hypothetical protein [Microcella alkalica]|uniref:hypothetical protein n=1 Tax=Microcella alkalica TaxID=355930 RepID=UPI0031DA92AF